LPTLPVPNLEESCKVYLKSLKPLVKNEEEYKQMERIVNEFKSPSGLGPILQKRL